MLQTGSTITVHVPTWFAKQNNCPTELDGHVLSETDQALRFIGRMPAKQRSHCAVCGRDLTHPVSLIVGIGPICGERIGIDRSEYESKDPEELRRIIGELEFALWIPKSIIKTESSPESESEQEPAPKPATVDFDYDRLERALAEAPTNHSAQNNGRTNLADLVEETFRTTFAAKMDGYEPREPQIEMARTVAQGFDEGRHVLSEAGTGTGKSFAALVPAIEHAHRTNQPVIVSTATIALQEQYVRKDVPFLKRILDKPFTAVLAKGKGNFVCKLRLEDEVKQAGLLGSDPVVEWAQQTETGDVGDFPENPDPATWNRINVDETCLGRKCPFYDSCHYFEAKRRANEADIVICNHYLFFADLQIKMGTGGHGGVLPPAAAVIFDEAHHVESIARDSLGEHVTNFKLGHWISSVRRLPALIDPDDYDRLQKANDALFESIAFAMEDDRQDVPPVSSQLVNELGAALSKVKGALDSQSSTFSDEDENRAGKLIDQADSFMHLIRDAVDDDTSVTDNWVFWAEREQRAKGWKVTIHLTPIDVAPILREHLFKTTDSVVLTSATISVGRRFDHIKGRLGIDQALELNVESPFNYRENCLLFVPKPATAPDPAGGNPEYHEKIAPMIEEILMKTDGRAFVLFTSYRGLNIVYDHLADRLRWQILRQGSAPRSQLVEQFKADTHSVLFGTKTFWEGVSIEGEALSCVIIDKLPFSVPSDPIAKAIAAKVEARGKSAFFELSLPEAVLNVKQGFGRLIRTKSDRGIVAILDKRIRTKSYGHTFLNSLPRARRIETLENVEAFLGVGKGGAA